MDSYIATFFSHYDALVFFNYLNEAGITPKLIPVPRRLSSSCGTCVAFEAMQLPSHNADCELEAIYKELQGGFLKIWE
ncbi:MAG: DUF3343 domain-containing protein [Defluviitaleaceae bacterium]|nr:DUF3343 domain-containing protein [Defluviitaleaceae bacterium]